MEWWIGIAAIIALCYVLDLLDGVVELMKAAADRLRHGPQPRELPRSEDEDL